MAFGGLVVFERLNFALERGERHAIIGPNGAGKTTFVSLVTGLLQPTAGDVLFNGRVITHESPQQRVKAGIARTFQINSLFKALNPLASLVIALAQREGRANVSLRSVSRERKLIDEASALLAKFGLADDALTVTETLPYGKQRLLEVALAFALRPQLLLLDEPAAGLSTAQGHELFRQLAVLTGDTTVLFIEHDMNLVFRYADRVSVFAAGALVVQDTPDKIRSHSRVREVYLGT
ncbi:MAG: ABC transporter ATP-binding protein [Xanthobacteraceae bacterium]|nr:ABC transporter ATP-binding protein [Xanthobacteraceae bacterium]